MNLFNQLLPHLHNFIEQYGVLGIFLGSILEEIIAPIPSALIQILGGILIMKNSVFNTINVMELFFLVSIPASLGVLIGSYLYFFLSKKFGSLFIEKYGKYLSISLNDLTRIEKKFDKSKVDEIVFIIMRAIPILPSLVMAIYPGIIKMSTWKYSYLTFIGIFIRASFLGGLGWLIGHEAKQIGDWFDLFEKLGLITLIILIIYLIYRKKRKSFFSKIHND